MGSDFHESWVVFGFHGEREREKMVGGGLQFGLQFLEAGDELGERRSLPA